MLRILKTKAISQRALGSQDISWGHVVIFKTILILSDQQEVTHFIPSPYANGIVQRQMYHIGIKRTLRASDLAGI